VEQLAHQNVPTESINQYKQTTKNAASPNAAPIRKISNSMVVLRINYSAAGFKTSNGMFSLAIQHFPKNISRQLPCKQHFIRKYEKHREKAAIYCFQIMIR
jgi:CRISPR/Cas system CMR-associated protein Cmr1 (group 7 of RAMP superfamily)